MGGKWPILGNTDVSLHFQEILEDIFGVDVMKQFQQKRPAGFVDLMIAFESRKRGTFRILTLSLLVNKFAIKTSLHH